MLVRVRSIEPLIIKKYRKSGFVIDLAQHHRRQVSGIGRDRKLRRQDGDETCASLKAGQSCQTGGSRAGKSSTENAEVAMGVFVISRLRMGQ